MKKYEQYAEKIVNDLFNLFDYFRSEKELREMAVYVIEMQIQALLTSNNLTRSTAYIMVDDNQVFLNDSINYLKQKK